jgi:hypothetical protein
MKKNGYKKYMKNLTTKNITMTPQTNEETLDQITALLNGYINAQSMTSAECISEITNLIEEHYINGSIANDYK